MTQGLNHVDLCFVVDTTGSMGAFIAEAKRQLVETMRRLAASGGLDLRVGLVEYRDHPPQDTSFVTRAYELTHDLARIQKVVNKLEANGGGDAPEAVYDGVHHACTSMAWRPASSRLALLVGDAPPHGFRAVPEGVERPGGGAAARPCLCGHTAYSVTAAAEAARVVVHAVPISGDRTTVEAFTELARGTGGVVSGSHGAGEVVEVIVGVLEKELASIELDARVLDAVRALGRLDAAEAAAELDCSRIVAASSIARLGKRGLLSEWTSGV